MKKIYKTYVIFFLVLTSSFAYSEKHNQVAVELDRIKNDIIDLQKFVYKNGSLSSNANNSNENYDLNELNKSINELFNLLNSLEKQIIDIKDDVSNLYSLYTSSNLDKKTIISTSDQFNIEESSSNIVDKSQDDQLLGQISLSKLESTEEDVIETIEDKNDEEIIPSTQENEKLEVIAIEPISNENIAILNEIDLLIEEREQFLNRPIINIDEQLKIAKASFASFDNESAIQNLLLIINSNTDQIEQLAETYYLLGRTYFMENNIIEAIKYFGIRHRDFQDIQKFKSENYFWLGKSLFSIGDNENGCLILEDLIFSDTYLDSEVIIQSAKSLQTEKECGLIID